MSSAAVTSTVLRVVGLIPVVGWALACLADARNEAKLAGIATLALGWILTTMTFGFAGFIYPLLTMVLANFIFVLILTLE